MLVLLSIIVFFAATRTEVGRDLLKQQIEQQFSQQFRGSLQIGKLTGNMVYRLVANKIVLRDESGRLVARVDSAIIRPRWRRVAQGRLELSRLYLYQAEADLRRDSSGFWNIQRLLKPRQHKDSASASITSVSIGDLRLLSARIATRSEAPTASIVRNRVLFDYENAAITIREMQAMIDVQPDYAQVDVINLSGRSEFESFDLSQLEGQFVIERGRLLANEVTLETPVSSIRLTGSIDKNGHEGDWISSDPTIDLDLTASPIDHSEWRRLFPRYPFNARTNAVARLSGPISAIVVEDLGLSRGANRMHVSGTVIGFPDSVDFELSVSDAVLTRRTVRDIVPAADIYSRTNIDSLAVSVLGRGVIHDPLSDRVTGRSDFFLDASMDAGRITGRVSLSRSTTEEPLMFSSDLVANRFQVDRLLPALGLPAVINGDLSVDGAVTDWADAAASAEANLTNSSFFGRQIDSLRTVAKLADRHLVAEATAVRERGRAEARVEAEYGQPAAKYAVQIAVDDLNAADVLFGDSLSSSITAKLDARFSFANIDDLAGDLNVRFDSSYVTIGSRQRLVVPHSSRLEIVRRDSIRTDIRVGGDIIKGQTSVDGRLSDVLRLADIWADDIRNFASNFLGGEAGTAAARYMPATTPPTTAGLPSAVGIDLNVKTNDTRILNSFFPGRPLTNADLEGKLRARLSTTTLTTNASFRGDSLAIGRIRATKYQGSLSLAVDRARGFNETLDAAGSIETDLFSLGGSGIPAFQVNVDLAGDEGRLTIAGDEGARVGPLNLAADFIRVDSVLNILPSKFEVRARGYDWRIVESNPIVVDGQSANTRLIVVENVPPDDGPKQRVEIRGGLSRGGGESVFAKTEQLDLSQVSNVLSLNRELGGQLNGEFQLSLRDDTPVVESQFTVTSFSLDTRVLGNLAAHSEIRPGTSDGVLDLVLSPATNDGSELTVVENDGRIRGTFRLPSFNRYGDRVDDGALDLTAEIRRADLFFFEYIFTNTVVDVTGFVAGDVTIGGTLSRPVFDADLNLQEGRFRVPRFNLAMGIEGEVTVDRYGIHIAKVTVTDKTGGEANLSGDVLFNDYRFFSFNLFGQLNDFQIMDIASSRELPFYGHIWATGPATLTGPLSQTELRATSVRTSPRSELFIPLVESQEGSDQGFIVFADSTGEIPDLAELTRRKNLLASRPKGERGFTEGMDMELNIDAPPGSTVHLVIDPLLGDVINAIGSGRVQIIRSEGEFQTFGTFQVNSGDYLFTAGEVFVRRFLIEEGGLITWDGDPTDALIDIPAAFRTRASRAGLTASGDGSGSLIPVVVNLRITGRVSAPQVDLSLAIDRSSQTISSTSDREFLETILNNPQQSTEYATSVLLTNSFALTTTGAASSDAIGTGAFNSLSQLVANQLNRYLSTALPNVDFSFGVQGESTNELDITYGVALRLLDERLVIRGQGVYQGTESSTNETLEGEFVVEIKLSSRVSVEVFYRREGDALTSERVLTSTTGAGVSYRTEFPTWKRFFNRLFGWLIPDKKKPTEAPEPEPPVAAANADRQSEER